MQQVERLEREKVVLQQSADTLARLQAEAASEVARVLQKKLQAEMGRAKQSACENKRS